MSFLSSWRLLLLVAPIALLVAYIAIQRRRHEQVVRFTSVAMLDSIAPRRSGWQRHVAPAAVLGSLVVMTLAFAQPAMATATPRDRATIVLALDTSASMSATDVSPSRLEAAEKEARSFISGLPDGVQVGLVTFDRSARLLVPPTKDHAALLAALGNLPVGPGTATADGITTSLSAIAGVPQGDSGTPTPAAIVLMSDGTPTVSDGSGTPTEAATAAAAKAKDAGVPIDTIAFGTDAGTVSVQGQDVPVPIDSAAMESIARESGGRSFTAATSDQLGSIYDQIGRDVAYEVTTHEVTAAFAGVGLLIAIGAAVAGLVWTQRLI